MSVDIEGWVEVWTAHDRDWHGAIKVETILGQAYTVFALVFGVLWDELRDQSKLPPLASGRGIPADASNEVRSAQTSVFTGDYGHTWVLWAELQSLPLGNGKTPLGEPLPGDWLILCRLMSCLADSYGSNCVRAVVWFS